MFHNIKYISIEYKLYISIKYKISINAFSLAFSAPVNDWDKYVKNPLIQYVTAKEDSGVEMSRTIWNKCPNTIKHAAAKLDWPFHPISSKCEFHSRKEKVDIMYFSHFRDISFSIHITEGDIHENVGISISRNHLKRFQ